MMKKLLLALSLLMPLTGFAAGTVTFSPSIVPLTNSLYYLGTTSPSTVAWKGVITDQLCLTADTCRTTWPSGSGGAFPFDVQSWGVSTTTVLGLLNGFISNASSTINANLLINGNSTTTSATTTNLFSTTASSTNLYGQFINGFGLVTCNSASSALTWAGGSYGCHTISSSGGGSGNVATSTQETATYIPFWTSTNGTPATLSGGSSLFTFGSGQGLLTISSLLATYASTTNLLATGSSTLQAFTATQSTTTSATTTNFFSTTASSSSLYTALFNGANLATCNSSTGKLTWAAGLFGCGTDNTSSSTLLGDSDDFTGNDTFSNTITGSITGNAGSATVLQNARTINGVSFNGSTNITVASTTLLGDNNNFSGGNIFANATSTNFFSTTASSTNLFGSLINGFGLSTCTGTNALTWTGGKFTCTAQPQGTVTAIGVTTANGVSGSSSGGATPNLTITLGDITPSSVVSAGLGEFANLWSNGSSTFQNFTGLQSTSTNATSTNAFATTASSTNLYSTNANLGLVTLGNATSTNFFSTTASTTNQYLGIGTCSGGNALNIVSGKITCGAVSSSGGINTFSTTTVQNLATTTIRANELPAGNNLRITFRSPNLVGSGTSTAATTIFVQFNTATDSGTSGLYFTNWLRSAALTSRNGVNAAQLTTGITSGFTNNGVRNMQTQLDFTVSNTSTQPKGGNYTLWQLSTSTNSGVAADTTLTGYLNFSSTTAPIQTIDIWTGTNAVGTVCSTACFATGTQITVDGYN